MGELIYCSQPVAEHPWLIRETGLHIYSVEELCYYIAQNASELDDSFMSLELCQWIDTQVMMHDLAVRLRQLIQKGAPLHVFVGNILLAVGYQSTRQVHEIVDSVAAVENKGIAERRKLSCDRLLRRGRYQEAIMHYRAILQDVPHTTTNPALIGDLWHNLGAAYARLFLYKRAGECFEKAYQYNHTDASLRAMLATYYLRNDTAMIEIQSKRYHIPDQLVKSVAKTIMSITSSGELDRYRASVDEMLKTDPGSLRQELGRDMQNYCDAMI